MAVRLSGAIVATAVLALAGPAVAGADVSSLDAYAGQAAVLGKPHHKHHRHGGLLAGHRSARAAGSGSAVALAGKPSRSAPASSHASGSTAVGGPVAGRPSGSAGATTSGGAAAGGGASASRSSSAPSGESGLERGVRNAVPASASSSSLTSVDVAVLCAAALMMVATGLLIRRLSRQPR
jgi:hypothetical protein